MRNYFFGRYFKCQSDSCTVAFIVAYHKSGGKKTASLQIITDTAAWNADFEGEEYTELSDGFGVRIGNNLFEKSGITLDLRRDELRLSGRLSFGTFAPIKGDIMGPFRFVPFMQCRHSVYSVYHEVNGTVTINGSAYTFDHARGYIEGDRGYSFPKEYLWTHSFICASSVMLSVAHIPIGPFHFTGIIGQVLHDGKQYRIATYKGAKPERIGDGQAIIRQKDLSLRVRLIEKQALPLYAPQNGKMARTIRESTACTAYYELKKGGKTLFESEERRASFEYEYPH